MPPLPHPFTPPLPPHRHHRLLSSPLSTRPHTAIPSDTTEWDPSMVSPARIDPFYTPLPSTTTTKPRPHPAGARPAEGVFGVTFVDPTPTPTPPPPAPSKRKRAPGSGRKAATPSTAGPAPKRRKSAAAAEAACTAAVAGITAVAAAATHTITAASSALAALAALPTSPSTSALITLATRTECMPLIDLYRAHAQQPPRCRRGMSILHTKLPYIGERTLLNLDLAGAEEDGVMGAVEMRGLVDAGEGSVAWGRLESVVRDGEVGGVCRRVVRFVEWS
ncbi:uncharacterized protein H6S33_004476 [Morchella sextelata]|uniref:uncharacterized protein n=1 Tax=Morchella sextelata TaxID=1174677 RepID=UPI001D05B353|nr:uncharacterized protein H6S33_004476 [Morchella sextelata]KAH0606019.1 hypothetical protein H6S33_004476 [Morchella sextelata]